MADDLIPPTLPEGSGEHGTDQQPANKHGDHIVNNPLSPEANQVVKGLLIPWWPSIVSRIAEVAFTWIFWIIGSDLQGAGHKVIGYECNCLAVMFFLLLAADLLFAQWQNRKGVLTMLIVACCFPIGIYGWLCIESSKVIEKPHFCFMFRTDDAPDNVLTLTNAFLTNGLTEETPTYRYGYLFIPVHSAESNVVVQFGVRNNSSVFAESIEAVVSFPPEYPVSPQWGWESSETGAQLKAMSTNLASVKLTSLKHHILSLLPGNAEWLPRLLWIQPPITNRPNDLTIMLKVRAKDVDTMYLSLNLMFLGTNSPKMPFLGQLDSTNGKPIIRVIKPSGPGVDEKWQK